MYAVCTLRCPTDVLEMVPWDGCKANQIASAPERRGVLGVSVANQRALQISYQFEYILGSGTTGGVGLSYWRLARLAGGRVAVLAL